MLGEQKINRGAMSEINNRTMQQLYSCILNAISQKNNFEKIRHSTIRCIDGFKWVHGIIISSKRFLDVEYIFNNTDFRYMKGIVEGKFKYELIDCESAIIKEIETEKKVNNELFLLHMFRLLNEFVEYEDDYSNSMYCQNAFELFANANKILDKYVKIASRFSFKKPTLSLDHLIAYEGLGAYNPIVNLIRIDLNIAHLNKSKFEETIVHELCHSIEYQSRRDEGKNHICRHCFKCEYCNKWLSIMSEVYDKPFEKTRTSDPTVLLTAFLARD